MRWRVGEKLLRTVYRDNQFVGLMDTAELARAVVDAMNADESRWENLPQQVKVDGSTQASDFLDEPCWCGHTPVTHRARPEGGCEEGGCSCLKTEQQVRYTADPKRAFRLCACQHYWGAHSAVKCSACGCPESFYSLAQKAAE